MIDAALALAHRGHSVSIVTAHHDRSRAFTETLDGSLRIVVAGSFLPARILGRAQVACAAARGVYGALLLAATALRGRLVGGGVGVDVVFVDQVPHGIPVLRLFLVPIVFYCHFPDKLLVQSTTASDAPRAVRMLHAAYRRPFDVLEEFCIGAANRVLVNSSFTARVFHRSFRVLRTMQIRPDVLHPSVDVRNGLRTWPEASTGGSGGDSLTLLSVNRFEKKKNLALAIEALHEYRRRRASSQRLRLVLAGGYDVRLTDNVECLEKLRALVNKADLNDTVQFATNVSDAERTRLLEACSAVVYTPEGEHFGIVPLEAMAAGRPVIAVRSGGPCETIVHGQTGWLCEPTTNDFADAYEEVARLASTTAEVEAGCTQSPASELERRGRAARRHVEANFSRELFGERLEKHLLDAVLGRSDSPAAEPPSRATAWVAREETFD